MGSVEAPESANAEAEALVTHEESEAGAEACVIDEEVRVAAHAAAAETVARVVDIAAAISESSAAPVAGVAEGAACAADAQAQAAAPAGDGTGDAGCETEKLWSAMVEVDADIPFEFVWPAIEDDILSALREVHGTWREMGWASKADLEESLKEAFTKSNIGAIARGLAKSEAHRVAGALREVPCVVQVDRVGAAAASALRAGEVSNADHEARVSRARGRLEKMKTRLGPARGLEATVMIQECQDHLRRDEVEVFILEDIEAFLDDFEAELGEGEGMSAYSSLDNLDNADGGGAAPSVDVDAVYSTMIHVDKEFPFDMIWPQLEGSVFYAISTVLRPGGTGFQSAAETRQGLQKGVAEKGFGPIARALKKTDAERLAKALNGIVQCTVEIDHEGAAAAASAADGDLTEVRTRLQQRLAQAREMVGELAPEISIALDRVESDMNDEANFKSRHRAMEMFFDRIEMMATKFNLHIDRDQFLSSALVPVLRATPGQLRPGRLNVKYMGEDAEDAGGVTRAFLAQAGGLLGDAQLGLFLPALRGYLQLNPLPGFLSPSHAGGVPNHPERWCRFLGRVLGMAVVHECPLGLLLVPSLCKRLLGQEISFEDLSFAPALNEAKGGGWYSSLRNMLAHRAPDLVDTEFLPRMNSGDLDGALVGVEARMPSRTMQTFESMLFFVSNTVSCPDKWESGTDVVACLLRGAKTDEQKRRVFIVAIELLQRMASSAPEEPGTPGSATASSDGGTSAVALMPSGATCLLAAPCSARSHCTGSDWLSLGCRGALRRLLTVVAGPWPSGQVTEINSLLKRLVGADGQKHAADESEVLNISGMWTMIDETAKEQLYFEWVQIPGSARFSGQELSDQGFTTISAGGISGATVQWEVVGVQFSGRLVDGGTGIDNGQYHEIDGDTQGAFTGMLMKTCKELTPLRPLHVPTVKTWLTIGVDGVVKSSGKFYYEVKLGLDMQCPQLGWLTPEFQKKDEVRDGVGDDEHGWAIDGMRQKFWHKGGKNCTFSSLWQGGKVIGLAVDIEAGELRFAVDGKWDDNVKQNFELGGRSLYPAVSCSGYFSLHISKDAWQFAPPDENYLPWGNLGVLFRPPPLLDGYTFSKTSAVARQMSSQISRQSSETSSVEPCLTRLTSKVPGITGDELSASNLPAFAEAVARKTLVTNLEPYLGPITEEFRKIAGEQKLQGVTWQQLQEMISGRQLNCAGWIQEWKVRTTYTFCDEETEVIKFWWAFVEARTVEELPKLFEWCTNYPACPTTAWKFRIQLVDNQANLPTIKLCMTDDHGMANHGVPEPVIYLPPYESKAILASKMSVVCWQKGASAAMNLV